MTIILRLSQEDEKWGGCKVRQKGIKTNGGRREERKEENKAKGREEERKREGAEEALAAVL